MSRREVQLTRTVRAKKVAPPENTRKAEIEAENTHKAEIQAENTRKAETEVM